MSQPDLHLSAQPRCAALLWIAKYSDELFS